MRPKRSATLPTQTPPPLELQPKGASQESQDEFPPSTDATIELTIRSTDRPIVGKPTVRNRVARPLIGARALIRTPGLNQIQMVVAQSPETNP